MPSRDLLFVDLGAGFVPAWFPSGPWPARVGCSGAGSPLGSLLCDPSRPWVWLARVMGWAWGTLQAWWPLAAVAALSAWALFALAVRRARAEAAGRALCVRPAPRPRPPPARRQRRCHRAPLPPPVGRTRRTLHTAGTVAGGADRHRTHDRPTLRPSRHHPGRTEHQVETQPRKCGRGQQ